MTVFVSTRAHSSYDTRCFGRVVGGPPGDAQQRLALGAAGSREPRSLCVFCLHAQEDLQGVQAWPGAVRNQHSSCVPGKGGSD